MNARESTQWDRLSWLAFGLVFFGGLVLGAWEVHRATGSDKTAGVTVSRPVAAPASISSLLALDLPSWCLQPGVHLEVLPSAAGLELPADAYRWETSDPGRAEVIAPGLVVLKHSGVVAVTASDGRVSATAQLDVREHCP